MAPRKTSDRQLRGLQQRAEDLELIQFTDPHLFADLDGEMRGVNTHDSLLAVVAAARKNHWPPDALLVTGDIAQDESRGGYGVFRSVFEPLDLPVLCLPGNHDNPEYMREELDGRFVVSEPVAFRSWSLLLLDTYLAGTPSGELSPDALAAAERTLAASPERHFLVCMHHQPVDVGSRWLDGVGLRNPDSLFAVLDRHANVRGIVWGHVHQQYDGARNGVRLMGTPSTCRQFKPGSERFALDDRPPGYRWLRLKADGDIETGVEDVPD